VSLSRTPDTSPMQCPDTMGKRGRAPCAGSDRPVTSSGEAFMRKMWTVLAVGVCVAAGCESTNTFNINFHDLNVNLGLDFSGSQPSTCSIFCHGGNPPPTTQGTVSGHCVDNFGEATLVVVNVNPTLNAASQPLAAPTSQASVTVEADQT